VLGDSVEKIIEIIRENEALSEADDSAQIESIRAQWLLVNEQVKAAGGLHIIGTERHESRCIDNQLRGRAGCQGDSGYSRFYLSLEDPLIHASACKSIRSHNCVSDKRLDAASFTSFPL